ncbi:TonB-dependent receptor plug [Hallella multisaccharivorax DSM 17128]|uniref:TonB-dependent receptor plug n=2 Tax=Hallella multisaccharivorax TaxID=310514 RepID=F8N813_9BACT|nr:SusC/RagA family TonB-linked outer membrane protein [Hallella multisaccharivorax]EGN57559.1 TonB-dependent receptor plug [Hallella multisaccharivorax DSM 17128]
MSQVPFKSKRWAKAMLALLLVSAPFQWVHAQITLNSSKTQLRTIIQKIKQQTKYEFFLDDRLASTTVPAIKVNNASIQEVLSRLLAGKDVTYRIEDDVVYLKRKEDREQATPKPQQPKGKATARKVSGTIRDEHGEPLIGATVSVVGTNQKAITDIDGNYVITTDSSNPVLLVSYIGYQDKELRVSGDNADLTLLPDAKSLNEVVVTALGIKREQKALSYNVQQVKGDELTKVKSTNFMNSLSGKVAGVTINASSAGAGGATKVVMRGPKSISQSNAALYVVDGVPINNTSSGSVDGGVYSAQPGSEGIADINPDDIESISVLSGPAAAALYGSAAAQGVIMITTKKGAEGKVKVTISNSSQFSNPFVMPEFQNEYVNAPGSILSWGNKEKSAFGDYNPKDFFNTGTNIQNNVSLTTGSKNSQLYLSLGTTNAKGIIPNNAYNRYNVMVRNVTKTLNDKLTLDFNFQYVRENDRNLMAQGQYFNPLTSVYLFPRGESFDAIRTYELYDDTRGIYTQNWNLGDALHMQNPYWVAYRMPRTNRKNRYMVNASAKYQVFDWLDVTARMRWDDAMAKQEDKRYASTIDLFAHSKYGFYSYDKINDRSLYGDLMANINKRWTDWTLSANLGASLSRYKYDATGYQGGLKAPSNIFTPNAIDYGSVTNDNRPIYSYSQHNINSLFANVEMGWRSMLYLTVTGRNDWDSALEGTAQTSFFYPSVGLSGVISEMVKLPAFIDYLKVRGSWASVGSAIPANISSKNRYEYNPASGTYSSVTYKFPDKFYPERTNSWEAGLSARLFNSAVTLDLTFYQSNTTKQTFLLDITSAGGYNKEYVQTGNVRNRGIELSLGYNKSWGEFSWNPTLTYSMNRNKIIKLFDDPDRVLSMGGLSGCEIILKKGGTMGDVYTTTDFQRDADGNIAVNDGKVVQRTLDNPLYRGSVLPKGNLGFSNEFRYKGLNLGFLISARFGGIVMSQTQAIMDAYGVSKRSAEVRGNGGVAVNRGLISAENYYTIVGGESPIWSEYIYSATNARLQEAHLSYTFPKKWLGDVSLTVGLVAHNLLMIYNKAPFDPESVASTGTYYQGFDYFMQPSLRSWGFNVNLQF